MRILLACDKFKGCLSAGQANAAVEAGLREALGDAAELHFTQAALADGGEGFAAGIIAAAGGTWHETDAEDALGRPIRARFGSITHQGRILTVLEMAEAAGLWRLRDSERDPRETHTRGVGQLLLAAAGCPLHPVDPPLPGPVAQIWVGIGGSATNDAGAGLAQALGFRFLDAHGLELAPHPAALADLARIVPPPGFPLPLPPIRVACDVTNPLLGPAGATLTYARQKGLPDAALAEADARLARLAALAPDPQLADTPGAGAAGGLGFGLMSFARAEPVPGFRLYAEATGLLGHLLACDLVVTGEGSLDHQSLHGKAPVALARLARAHGKPCYALAGRVDDELLQAGEFAGCWSIHAAHPALDLPELVARAPEFLTELARTGLAPRLRD